MCDPSLGLKITQQSDMWMLGCVMFTLMFYRHPFYNSSKIGIVQASIIWPENITYSQELVQLIKNLIVCDPQ